MTPENCLFTERLCLAPCDIETYSSILAGDDALAAHLQILVPIDWSEFGVEHIRYAQEQLEANIREQPWWMYLFIHTDTRSLAGSGGFKGSPKNGVVEIGYEIVAYWRNQGFATEAAQALIAFAFSHPEVMHVHAHTLAEESESCAVLKKCGFTFSEEMEDPIDGLIWRWVLSR